MPRLVLLAALGLVALAARGEAASTDWAFRTPGHLAYCDFVESGFECMTPNDGFWIRLTTDRDGLNARVKKGYNDASVGYRNTTVQLLPYGRQWASSDAFVFSCWSRTGGLTCKHVQGLSFWLGRQRGYRIFIDAPGFKPAVRPFFRTSHGVWCGLWRDTFVPENPSLHCWRPADGLSIGVSHDGGVYYERHEQSRGYRPQRFPPLGRSKTFSWRCERVTAKVAEQCSTRTGTAVFTCVNRPARLTCMNRSGRGFWVNARSFYGF